MQMIFQDPHDSLDPRMRIASIIAEPLLIHRMVDRGEIKQKVAELLELVGLSPMHMDRFPHEFSGGQRQRIVLARALSLKPKFIIADEPLSALDASVQAQIINLLLELHEKLNSLQHCDPHTTYHPHVTVAFVQAGRGASYARNAFLAGLGVPVRSLTYSGFDGTVVEIPMEWSEEA